MQWDAVVAPGPGPRTPRDPAGRANERERFAISPEDVEHGEGRGFDPVVRSRSSVGLRVL